MSKERQENLRYPKSTVGSGSRWIVEIVMSAIKRMFGEDVKALKWSNIAQEVKLRIWLYKWIAEAVAAMWEPNAGSDPEGLAGL